MSASSFDDQPPEPCYESTNGIDSTIQELRFANDELRATNRILEDRLDSLGSRLSDLEMRLAKVPATHEERVARAPESAHSPITRRRLLAGAAVTGVLASYAGLVVARPALAYAWTGGGTPGSMALNNHMIYYDNVARKPQEPPLDSPIIFSRRSDTDTLVGNSHQVLSLILESAYGAPWVVFAQLTTTSQDFHGGTGYYMKLFNQSIWCASFHTDLIHETSGVSLGLNVELTRLATAGTAIGVNIQNIPTSLQRGDHAIQIQSTSPSAIWQNGINFSGGNFIAGNIGINMASAQYNMGIDLAGNDIRMNAGRRFYLEGTDQVYITYNVVTGNVECHKGNKVVVLA